MLYEEFHAMKKDIEDNGWRMKIGGTHFFWIDPQGEQRPIYGKFWEATKAAWLEMGKSKFIIERNGCSPDDLSSNDQSLPEVLQFNKLRQDIANYIEIIASYYFDKNQQDVASILFRLSCDIRHDERKSFPE